MLWTIFVILLVLWLLGVVSSYTLGGFIHILLVIALVVLVIQLITGTKSRLTAMAARCEQRCQAFRRRCGTKAGRAKPSMKRNHRFEVNSWIRTR